MQDELDLPVAALKLKAGGGLAGHNGLRSIKSHLHSDEFLRVRIGVSKPVSKERGADHVLNKFGKRERAEIDVTIERAADAVEAIARDGIDRGDERVQLTGGSTPRRGPRRASREPGARRVVAQRALRARPRTRPRPTARAPPPPRSPG